MHTMGLSDLHLVAPVCDPLAEETFWMANHAAHIVRSARRTETLEESLSDTVFSVGTTRRSRRLGYPVYAPEEVAREILARTDTRPAAIVFGRESTGLTNPELALCSIQSTIPTASEQHVLNLSQAVQVYCYALFQASLSPEQRSYQWNLATHEQEEHFFAHLRDTLARLRTKPATTMDSYLARFRRVLARMPLEPRDLNLLHKLLSKVEDVIEKGSRNWESGDKRQDVANSSDS